MHAQVNKVVLAYSGGLDTSVILKWLQETYECEVVTFTADLGQARPPNPNSNPVSIPIPVPNPALVVLCDNA